MTKENIECYCQKCGRKTTIFKATYIPLFGKVCRSCWSEVLEKRKALEGENKLE